MRTAIAVARVVDRLFDRFDDQEQRDLTALAEIELRLEAHRRVRRFMIGAAAAASVLCWAYARFAIAALVCAPLLFAFFTLAVVSVWFWERRLGAERRRILVRLPTLARLGEPE